MTAWISATDVFAIVLDHELSPDIAHNKIMAAIKGGKLPVRGRIVNFDGEDFELGVLPMSFWEAKDADIDFDNGTARSIIIWNTSSGIPATNVENARALEFSERHLFELWPKPAKPSLSIRSRAKLADTPPKKRGRTGNNVTRGIIDRMKVMDRAALKAMKDEEMVAKFGGVRSTCQDARKIALKEMPADK